MGRDTVEARGGRVVRLTEGKFDQEKSYGDDPLAVAKDFAASGAAWLHVVDLDGAREVAGLQVAVLGDPVTGERPASVVSSSIVTTSVAASRMPARAAWRG